MRTQVLVALGCLMAALACREKPTSYTETFFLSYFGSATENYCAGDSLHTEENRKGSLLLHAHNKALLTIRDEDTIHYYRGTYRLIENGVYCSFDAKYNHAKKDKRKNGAKKSGNDGEMMRITPWSLSLLKTGCADVIYYSDKPSKNAPLENTRLVYREADAAKAGEYLARINSIPALKDFHGGLSEATKKKSVLNEKLIAEIEGHYRKQYAQNSRIQRISKDSAVELVFSFRKIPPGESNSPFLYVNIPVTKRKALTGDVNADGHEDLVLQPALSQGGNSAWKEVFVFINDGHGGYRLACNASGFDLAQHRRNSHSGHFSAEEIRAGHLFGTSTSYLDDDAACCPSVKIPTRVKVENGRLLASSVRKQAVSPAQKRP